MEYLLGRKCHRRSCDREGDDRGVRETVISENYSAKKWIWQTFVKGKVMCKYTNQYDLIGNTQYPVCKHRIADRQIKMI